MIDLHYTKARSGYLGTRSWNVYNGIPGIPNIDCYRILSTPTEFSLKIILLLFYFYKFMYVKALIYQTVLWLFVKAEQDSNL